MLSLFFYPFTLAGKILTTHSDRTASVAPASVLSEELGRTVSEQRKAWTRLCWALKQVVSLRCALGLLQP